MEERIGAKLLAKGLITAKQLEQAVEKQQATGSFLGGLLVDMGAVTDADLTRCVAEQLAVPYVDLNTVKVNLMAAMLYPAPKAREHKCFPYQLANGQLRVAMANPLDVEALEDLAFASGCTVHPAVAEEAAILAAIHKYSPARRAAGPDQMLEEVERALARGTSRCQTISVLSNKGGVGKTHVALNLAYCLSQQGKRVLLVDADMGNADISHKLNLYPKLTLLDLLDADRAPDDIITQTPHAFDLIASRSGEARLANLQYIQRVALLTHLVALAQPYDYMVLDLAAGIATQVIDLGLAADRMMIVTTPRDVVAGYACAKVAFLRYVALQRKMLAAGLAGGQERLFCPSIIVNRLSYMGQGDAVFERICSAARKHLNPLISDYQMIPNYRGGVLYDDDAIAAAEARHSPVAQVLPRSRAAQCFAQLAAQILDPLQEPPQPVISKGLARLARFLGLRPDETEAPLPISPHVA